MNNPEKPTRTGEQMLGDIGFFQAILETGSGLTDDVTRRVEKALEVSTARFNEAASFAGVLESVVRVYDSDEQVTNKDSNSETIHPDLNPEQSNHVQEVISAMEDKFPNKKFELIKLPNVQNEEQKEEGPESTNKETANRFTVICTDQAGVDLGDSEQYFDHARSRQSIMANPEDERFIIQTKEGETYDTRQGMTLESYEALVEHCNDTNQPLPDTEKVTIDGDEFNTWTVLTGDRAGGVGGPFAGVRAGSVVGGVTNVRDDRRDLRFRPAVMLEF